MRVAAYGPEEFEEPMPASHDPLESILAIAEGSLHAADLAERDLVCVEPWWKVGEALEWLDRENIDVAPVREEATRRYVLREQLRERRTSQRVADVASVVDINHLVTGDVGLGEALELLEDRGFLFTIEGGGIAGIITPSDVQRTPVSMVVLAVILAAEAGMTRLIAACYETEDGWQSKLSPERAKALEKRYQKRVRRNAEMTRLDLLMLEDRLAVVAKTRSLWGVIGFGSRRGFERWAHRLQVTRDELAHGHSMLDVEPDPVKALALVRRVRAFAADVWRAPLSPTGV